MVNKSVFSTKTVAPAHNTRNEAGGVAYDPGAKHSLAQYAVTGTFNGVYYAGEDEQLEKMAEFCKGCDSEFIAQCALYSRCEAAMKDMPAYLLAVLHGRGENVLLRKYFPQVIDSVKMLANFVQIVRSGAVGRKSFGSSTKKVIQDWLAAQKDEFLFKGSVGVDNPSLKDIVKMVHPSPVDMNRKALYGYLIEKEYIRSYLPEQLQAYLSYKENKEGKSVPNVPFQMLASLDLSEAEWTEIARNAGWTMTRMNLNTFARHGVLANAEIVGLIAERLSNRELVRQSRCFPYQLLTAFLNTTDAPKPIRLALQNAMEIATENIPAFAGKTVVAVDISGSMTCAVTGTRKGSTSKARCYEVASMFAACIARTSKDVRIISFDTHARTVNVNPRDSIPTIAKQIVGSFGGGTDCAAALRLLNQEKASADTVIYLSDNESWHQMGNSTCASKWQTFSRRNPKSKLVCVDLQPYATVQVQDSRRVLNVGGFSDNVFKVIDQFIRSGEVDFVKTVENYALRAE